MGRQPVDEPLRGQWGWAPGHPYSRIEIPGTAGFVVYLLLAMYLGFTALFLLWVMGVLR